MLFAYNDTHFNTRISESFLNHIWSNSNIVSTTYVKSAVSQCSKVWSKYFHLNVYSVPNDNITILIYCLCMKETRGLVFMHWHRAQIPICFMWCQPKTAKHTVSEALPSATHCCVKHANHSVMTHPSKKCTSSRMVSHTRHSSGSIWASCAGCQLRTRAPESQKTHVLATGLVCRPSSKSISSNIVITRP